MIFFELFYVFFLIGLFTFGGGYGMISMVSEQVVTRGWISDTVLSNFVAVSQSTPGPFAINIATFVGSQTAGVFGAICATLGVIMPSFIIILIVAAIMNKFLHNRYVKGALIGVRPVIVGLIFATAMSFLFKLVFQASATGSLYVPTATYRQSLTIFIMLLGFYIGYRKVKKKSPNPIALLGISAVLGLVVFWIL